MAYSLDGELLMLVYLVVALVMLVIVLACVAYHYNREVRAWREQVDDERTRHG